MNIIHQAHSRDLKMVASIDAFVDAEARIRTNELRNLRHGHEWQPNSKPH